MPKLHLCTVCEKLLLDKEEIPSLINLFSKIVVTPPPNAGDIPKEAVVPKEWYVLAIYILEPGDFGREFFLCMQIFYPDGTPFGSLGRVQLKTPEGKERSQASFYVPVFPIGQRGMYRINLWLEENERRVEKSDIDIDLELLMKSSSEKQGTAQ